MIGIDTNVLVRFLTHDDKAQAQVAEFIICDYCTPENPGFITVVTMVELFWTLRQGYDLSRMEILTAIQGLLNSANLVFQCPDEVHHACKLYASQRADFADALIGAISKTYGCTTTFTFDKTAATLPDFSPASNAV